MWPRWIYSLLLRLYPAEFQVQFREEMLAVFGEAESRRRGCSLGSRMLFYAGEMLGIVAGAACEYAARRASKNAPEELPFPTDLHSDERYIAVMSQRVVQAIANHDFAGARRYDLQDRKARALVALLRG